MHQELHDAPGDTFISLACMDCDAETQAKQGVSEMIGLKDDWANYHLVDGASSWQRAMDAMIIALPREDRKKLADMGMQACAAGTVQVFGGGPQGRARAFALLHRHGSEHRMTERRMLHELPPPSACVSQM